MLLWLPESCVWLLINIGDSTGYKYLYYRQKKKNYLYYVFVSPLLYFSLHMLTVLSGSLHMYPPVHI